VLSFHCARLARDSPLLTSSSGRRRGQVRVGGCEMALADVAEAHDPSFLNSQQAMLIVDTNNASITATIHGNTFRNNQGGTTASGAPRALQAVAENAATMNLTLGGPSSGNGNTFDTAFVLVDLDPNSSSQSPTSCRAIPSSTLPAGREPPRTA
jgi:hypothetical protein